MICPRLNSKVENKQGIEFKSSLSQCYAISNRLLPLAAQGKAAFFKMSPAAELNAAKSFDVDIKLGQDFLGNFCSLF